MAFLAYNALQTFVCRHLGIDPRNPQRTFGDILGDFYGDLLGKELGPLVDAVPSIRRVFFAGVRFFFDGSHCQPANAVGTGSSTAPASFGVFGSANRAAWFRSASRASW